MADVLSYSGVVVCSSQKGGSKIASVDKPLTNCRPSLRAGCDHRRCSMTVVFTELGCHGRCLACGVLGPGCPTSEAARQALMVPELAAWAAGH